MPPPAERGQEGRRLARVGRLAQDAAAKRDGGVGTKNHILRPRWDGHGLLLRKPQGIGARKLALAGVLVDVGRKDQVGHESQLRQKFLPARTARSKNKLHLNR